jgi:hypothetical protein
LPGTAVCELGVVEMLKSGLATTRVTVAECDRLPSVPVIVSVYVPVGVVVAVEIVSVEWPEPETDMGLKPAVAPVGRPLTLRFTAPVKPLRGLSDAV